MSKEKKEKKEMSKMDMMWIKGVAGLSEIVVKYDNVPIHMDELQFEYYKYFRSDELFEMFEEIHITEKYTWDDFFIYNFKALDSKLVLKPRNGYRPLYG